MGVLFCRKTGSAGQPSRNSYMQVINKLHASNQQTQRHSRHTDGYKALLCMLVAGAAAAVTHLRRRAADFGAINGCWDISNTRKPTSELPLGPLDAGCWSCTAYDLRRASHDCVFCMLGFESFRAQTCIPSTVTMLWKCSSERNLHTLT